MMRKQKRAPALPGALFCPAFKNIFSVRLKGRHRRGSALMFLLDNFFIDHEGTNSDDSLPSRLCRQSLEGSESSLFVLGGGG